MTRRQKPGDPLWFLLVLGHGLPGYSLGLQWWSMMVEIT